MVGALLCVLVLLSASALSHLPVHGWAVYVGAIQYSNASVIGISFSHGMVSRLGVAQWTCPMAPCSQGSVASIFHREEKKETAWIRTHESKRKRVQGCTFLRLTWTKS